MLDQTELRSAISRAAAVRDRISQSPGVDGHKAVAVLNDVIARGEQALAAGDVDLRILAELEDYCED